MKRFDWIEFYYNQRMIVITFMLLQQLLEVEKLNDKKRKLKAQSFRPIPPLNPIFDSK